MHAQVTSHTCVHWHNHATNEEVMRACMERLQDIVTTSRRKLAGHILRLQRERPAYTAMYWAPEDGIRTRYRQEKTWRSTFQEDREEMGVSWHGVRRIASDRDMWRPLVARCSERNRWNYSLCISRRFLILSILFACVTYICSRVPRKDWMILIAP